MEQSPDFTPHDVVGDWNRFGHCWVQHVDLDGNDIGGGLLELLQVELAAGPNENTWRKAHIFLRNADGVTVTVAGLPNNTRLNFAPSWKHKGYSMVTNRHAISGGTRCVWISLTSARQYRYGLSERAMLCRATNSMFSLGHSRAINLGIAGTLFRNGPVFTPYSEVQPESPAAISPALGLSPAVPNVAALCWNAKIIIGFWVDGKLMVENRSKALARSLPADYRSQTSYVRTEKLTEVYKTQILPASMERGEGILPGDAAPRRLGEILDEVSAGRHGAPTADERARVRRHPSIRNGLLTPTEYAATVRRLAASRSRN